MTKAEIKEALEVVIHDLTFAINTVKREHPEDPFRAQYKTGEYILLNALVAEALALGALARLEET